MYSVLNFLLIGTVSLELVSIGLSTAFALFGILMLFFSGYDDDDDQGGGGLGSPVYEPAYVGFP